MYVGAVGGLFGGSLFGMMTPGWAGYLWSLWGACLGACLFLIIARLVAGRFKPR
jgi:uncharacterized membrane protein YeaQ/YmgE (transglycosylase-associated protein family)